MTDPATVAGIAGKLTKAQREAMLHPNAGGCAYRWATMGTLKALYARKLIGKQSGLGSMFSPQTSIKWPFKPLGLAVRAHLERTSHDPD